MKRKRPRNDSECPKQFVGDLGTVVGGALLEDPKMLVEEGFKPTIDDCTLDGVGRCAACGTEYERAADGIRRRPR